VVRSLIRSGAALDRAGVYFLARLSARYPTVEVRVADACLTTDDAVMFAGVVRALVASLIDDVQRGARSVPVSAGRVDANLLAAARHGVRRPGACWPAEPEGVVAAAVARLLAKITQSLDAAGDGDEIRAGLERLRRVGTGADRQRLVWTRTGAADAFVASLADATVRVTSPS
jgi:carboxylate-amine ligase